MHIAKHKFIFSGAVILSILCVLAVFADFISPYHFEPETRKKSYAPISKIHFFDTKGNFYLRPFIYDVAYSFDKNFKRIYQENFKKKYPLVLLPRGDSYKLLGIIPTNLHLFGTQEPAKLYLLGADSKGRDLFTRILYSLRISLSISLIGALITYILGMIIGGISGFYGGKIDFIIMRLCEMIMMVPGFYLMLALRSAFPPELESWKVYFLLVIIFSFIGWASLARIIRGMVLSIKAKEFVLSAKAMGVSNFKIIIKHILPHTFSYAIISIMLSIPGYILGEASLSMIGLGIKEPYPSLGNLLSQALNITQLQFHPWILFPGVAILIIVIAFNMLGDGLRDWFDPHYKNY